MDKSQIFSFYHRSACGFFDLCYAFGSDLNVFFESFKEDNLISE